MSEAAVSAAEKVAQHSSGSDASLNPGAPTFEPPSPSSANGVSSDGAAQAVQDAEETGEVPSAAAAEQAAQQQSAALPDTSYAAAASASPEQPSHAPASEDARPAAKTLSWQQDKGRPPADSPRGVETVPLAQAVDPAALGHDPTALPGGGRGELAKLLQHTSSRSWSCS